MSDGKVKVCGVCETYTATIHCSECKLDLCGSEGAGCSDDLHVLSMMKNHHRHAIDSPTPSPFKKVFVDKSKLTPEERAGYIMKKYVRRFQFRWAVKRLRLQKAHSSFDMSKLKIQADEQCGNCEDAAATVKCGECDMNFCSDCSDGMHKSRSRKDHVLTKLRRKGSVSRRASVLEVVQFGETCENCEDADAAYHCASCRMIFCEDCDEGYHKSSKRKAHSRIAINAKKEELERETKTAPKPTALCDNCEEEPAVVHCDECGPKDFCSECDTAMHVGKRRGHLRTPLTEDASPTPSAPPASARAQSQAALCDNCEMEPVHAVCAACNLSMCQECDAAMHKKGARANHTRVPVAGASSAISSSSSPSVDAKCTRCGAANPGIYCGPCNAILCLKCNVAAHKTKARKFHQRERYTGQQVKTILCALCEDSEATVQCVNCAELGGDSMYCKSCDADIHVGDTKAHVRHPINETLEEEKAREAAAEKKKADEERERKNALERAEREIEAATQVAKKAAKEKEAADAAAATAAAATKQKQQREAEATAKKEQAAREKVQAQKAQEAQQKTTQAQQAVREDEYSDDAEQQSTYENEEYESDNTTPEALQVSVPAVHKDLSVRTPQAATRTPNHASKSSRKSAVHAVGEQNRLRTEYEAMKRRLMDVEKELREQTKREGRELRDLESKSKQLLALDQVEVAPMHTIMAKLEPVCRTMLKDLHMLEDYARLFVLEGIRFDDLPQLVQQKKQLKALIPQSGPRARLEQYVKNSASNFTHSPHKKKRSTKKHSQQQQHHGPRQPVSFRSRSQMKRAQRKEKPHIFYSNGQWLSADPRPSSIHKHRRAPSRSPKKSAATYDDPMEVLARQLHRKEQSEGGAHRGRSQMPRDVRPASAVSRHRSRSKSKSRRPGSSSRAGSGHVQQLRRGGINRTFSELNQAFETNDFSEFSQTPSRSYQSPQAQLPPSNSNSNLHRYVGDDVEDFFSAPSRRGISRSSSNNHLTGEPIRYSDVQAQVREDWMAFRPRGDVEAIIRRYNLNVD
jgi:hypothetical protein